MFIPERLKYHVKIIIIHFIAFLDSNHITKRLTSHQRNICSYFQVQMRICQNLNKNLSEIRILTILNRIIRVKIQE